MKERHIRIIDEDGITLVNNLTEKCKICLETCNFDGKLINDCPEYGGKRRQGIRKTYKGETFFCSAITKTTKLFKQQLEAINYSIPELSLPRKAIRITEQKKVNRLLHNLTSINAHNIQEIYDLVPQDVLAQNWRKQVDFIKEELKRDPDSAALLFLRIAKHNVHMKSEFSIYKKMERDDKVDLDFKLHNLRNVLLNTLHTFFSDFSRRDIYVEVNDFYFNLRFDYETIQVAFYHLLENASKYACPKSKIEIGVIENDSSLDLYFKMHSIYVHPEERERIMREGVSGKVAQSIQRQGDGIGMWRINQMMEINQGKFICNFGDSITKRTGIKFSNNTFILRFKKC